MKAYIAGKLGTSSEREELEKIDKMCQSIGFKTYLPHRDGGLARGMKDVSPIFKSDITDNLPNCDVVIAILDGLHVGSGTAWELGFAYAKGIPTIGLKTDEPISEALDYLSPMILASMPIVSSVKALETGLKNFFKRKKFK